MGFINPFTMFVCPFCAHTFHLGECKVHSTVTSGKVLYVPPSATGNASLWERLRSRFQVETLDGPEYTLEQARRECPHCKNLLPHSFGQGTTFNIAIVGGPGSGKSHYIASLIHSLKEGGIMQDVNKSVIFDWLNPGSEKLFEDMYEFPLFREQRALEPTQGAIAPERGKPVITPPLLFRLAFRDHTQGKSFNVTIYDASGEDLADPLKLVQFKRHILEANAIIYLADLATMPAVTNELFTNSQSDIDEPPPNSYAVLHQVKVIIEQYKRLAPAQLVDIPLAVAVSKSDMLKEIIPSKEHNNYAFMQEDVFYDGKANTSDLKRVDEEVRGLLERFGERRLIQETQVFSKVSFFAVSATGNNKDDEGRYPEVKQQRCLDPFLWVLWCLKAVDASIH